MSDEDRLTRAKARTAALAGRAAELFPVRVVRKFAQHGGGSQAVLIAWNSLTAVFPIALALAAIGGFVLRAAGLNAETLAERMGTFFPSDLQTQVAVIQGIDSLQKQAGLFALLALLGFLWTGSGLFGAMDEAFGVVFETPARPFLRQKLMAMVMIGIFAVLALLAVGTSALVPLLDQVSILPISLTRDSAAYILQLIIGVVSGFLLFLAIYMVVPNRRQRPLRVLPAAIFGAVALELLSQLWPYYIRLNQAGINRYGSQFALLFVLVAFFYFLGVITIVGADIIAVLDPPDPARSKAPEPANDPPRPMGRVRRTAYGAAGLLIGVVVGRRSRA